MKISVLILFIFLVPSLSYASFANYNSILIGERAAGMGGAYTALTGDPAGCSFYNPATLSRMHGSALSAAMNVYAKSDTRFGSTKDLAPAPLRINKGKISPIPASSGNVFSYGNFALGLSIIFPDFDLYNGDVLTTSEISSFLNQRDESLWLGGSIAINTAPQSSVGLTMYYTSRSLSRSVTDTLEQGSVLTISTINKTLETNSIVYILGAYYEITPDLTFGASHRFKSIPINGDGTYFKSVIASDNSIRQTDVEPRLKSRTIIPSKTTIGFGYKAPKKQTYSLDFSYHGSAKYNDMDQIAYSDEVEHVETWNVNFGYERYLKKWAALRIGGYSNISSHPKVVETPTRRQGDHINMWGFSTNFAFHLDENSSITLGGFYSGGKGQSVQASGQSFTKIQKSIHIFNFLVGTSIYF